MPNENSDIQCSVIVPTHNRAKALKVAIDSVCRQRLAPEAYELLLIDNASTDDTKAVADAAICAWPDHDIRYIPEPVPGLLSGRHRGAGAARGSILVFIDDDICADGDWLSAIIETFKEKNVQLVGGRNLPNYESDPPVWIEKFWRRHPFGRFYSELSLLDFGTELRNVHPNYVWGLNFSIRKEALYALGGFHPDSIPKRLQHFQGDGETGLTMRAAKHGYRAAYQPRALVYHQVPAGRMTFEYFDARHYYQGVCNSFGEIRLRHRLDGSEAGALGKIKRWAEPLGIEIKKGVRFASDYAFTRDQETRALMRRFRDSFKAGYRFHQDAVKKHPELLRWVLKENYWEYQLPELRGFE
jgi:glucosyl-dolichyl phosphate glucuronosyltransferase